MTNINLGLQPISNRFLYKPVKNPKSYEMNLIWNEQLDCMSLSKTFPIHELKPQFEWITCFEPEDHLDELALFISKLNNINKTSVIGAFSFKDDTTLNRLNKMGFINTWRINPELDLKIRDKICSVETFQSKFSRKISSTILYNKGKADIFIARHVIEHAYDIFEFVMTSQSLVKDNGYIVFELPDCERGMMEGDCTILWEEHINYFTETSFKNFVKGLGFEIVFWNNYNYPLESSITVILKNNSLKVDYLKNKKDTIEQQNIFKTFKEKMYERKSKIYHLLFNFKKKIGPIAILGAGHLSSTFLSVNNLDNMIDFVIDDNPSKNNMYMPNGNLKIVNSKFLDKNKIKMCLIGANPQNHKKIMHKHNQFINEGGIFKSIFPGTNNDIGEYL